MTVTPTPASSRPDIILGAFVLYLVALGVYLLESLTFGLGRIIANEDAVARSAAGQHSPAVAGQLAAMQAVSHIVVSIFMVLFVALLVRFAFALKRGAGWARIVFTVLSAYWLTGTFGAWGLGAILAAAGATATVLVWLTPATAWFREMKAQRRASAAATAVPDPQ